MTQSSDPIVQTKKCPISGKEFPITQWDVDFYDKISPTFAGQKFQIPTPTLCPEERQRRRLAFRNERNLYRRTCDASGKQIISIYSPDKPYKVYDQKIRWSDSRDAMGYGRDFNFSKTFTENFRKLMLEVPRYNLYNFDNENSDYVQYLPHSKNCYLVFWWRYCSDCYYGWTLMECNDCVDCLYIEKCQYCYECIDCLNCNNCFYCFDSQDCNFSTLLNNCKWCAYCFNCDGLVNQKYCINNKQHTKDEYQQYISSHITSQSRTIKNITRRLVQENCDNCSWNFLYNSKNIYHSNQSWDSEDIRYSSRFAQQKDSIDIYGSAKWSLLYESLCCDYNHKTLFWFDSEYCDNSFYIDHCFHSNNLFWCIGLRNKSYCIFNKQYTKEEYENLVAKIITHMQSAGEWWEFFHPSLSPFGYNETVAQEYYPLQKIEDERWTKEDNRLSSISYLSPFWYHRSDYESPKPVSDKVIQGKDLPESIDEVQDDILHYAIACEVTGKLFRIQPQELVFYRKHHIQLPRKHPDQRHLERLALRK